MTTDAQDYYTDVLPGYSFVSKCLITHITGIRAITLFILWCTVRLLCWLNMLWLEFSLVPYWIVNIWKSTIECCSWAFAEATILDTPFA